MEETMIDRIAPGTQYKHQCYLKGVLEMIVDRSGIGRNPMNGVIWKKTYLKKLKAERGAARTALGPEGRARLFRSKAFTGGHSSCWDPLFWTPLITRYGGLRAEEALQLRPEDVREQDGILVMDIHAGRGNSLKSPSAVRLIPVHNELLRLGLRELARRRQAEGAGRLLEVKRGCLGTYSSWFSKRYHNYRVGEDLYERGKDHHSLRKDFYQDLRRGDVDYALRVGLMGHALEDVSEKYYGPEEESIVDLKRAIDSIPSDTLHIRPVFG